MSSKCHAIVLNTDEAWQQTTLGTALDSPPGAVAPQLLLSCKEKINM
ncbi:hypothetical protein [Brasilonema sp. UFV-L1]|nr:hypothetical protein [Brasilonema sp. UFV-L1]